MLPKNEELCKIRTIRTLYTNSIVTKAVIKANISYSYDENIYCIVPFEITEVSFKGSDTSNVTDMSNMFEGCSILKIIKMKGCSDATIDKIKAVKPSSATIITTI